MTITAVLYGSSRCWSVNTLTHAPTSMLRELFASALMTRSHLGVIRHVNNSRAATPLAILHMYDTISSLRQVSHPNGHTLVVGAGTPPELNGQLPPLTAGCPSGTSLGPSPRARASSILPSWPITS